LMHRFTAVFAVATVATLAAASPAAGAIPHTVRPGETLWSIAAANNLTTHAFAAANGLPETASLVAGQTIQIPSVQEAAAALSSDAGAHAPPAMGAYTVRPGDTLSELAARSGVSAGEVAYMNGLDPDAALIAGTALKLPTGSPLAEAPGPAPTAWPAAGPHPTDEFVSPALVGQIAAEHGVPPSLAAAVAKQESGFNNGVVSAANARGVMQVLPGTWDFIQGTLAGYPLDPASARENVHAGVLYLSQLLRDSGGDQHLAVAAYYQGLGSVRRVGLLEETRRYVEDVMALRSQFGG
jgi:soluble lytic murein transglycosylase-like protein